MTGWSFRPQAGTGLLYFLLRKARGDWEWEALPHDTLLHNDSNFLKHSEHFSSHFISLQWNEGHRLGFDR